MSLEKNRH